eukprot:6786144-Alexandrium_andersonii.AAC.1
MPRSLGSRHAKVPIVQRSIRSRPIGARPSSPLRGLDALRRLCSRPISARLSSLLRGPSAKFGGSRFAGAGAGGVWLFK